MKKSKLYTRTGDGGMTTTASGERIPKTDKCIEVYGTIDELNSNIGYLVSLLSVGSEDKSVLEHIQAILFNIGMSITGTKSGTGRIIQKEIDFLERRIAKEDAKLPELNSFLIPGGTPAASYAHICRTVCRRAERRMLSLSHERAVPLESIIYVNRLSDYLFVLSRKLNFVDNIIDNITEKSIDNPCR